MGTIASQITSLTIVYSSVYSGADQRKPQSSASLAFMWRVPRGPVNSPHKWPVTLKMFPFYNVIMYKNNLSGIFSDIDTVTVWCDLSAYLADPFGPVVFTHVPYSNKSLIYVYVRCIISIMRPLKLKEFLCICLKIFQRHWSCVLDTIMWDLTGTYESGRYSLYMNS